MLLPIIVQMIVKAVVGMKMGGGKIWGGWMASERSGGKQRVFGPLQKQLNKYKYISKLEPAGPGIHFLKQDLLHVL